MCNGIIGRSEETQMHTYTHTHETLQKSERFLGTIVSDCYVCNVCRLCLFIELIANERDIVGWLLCVAMAATVCTRASHTHARAQSICPQLHISECSTFPIELNKYNKLSIYFVDQHILMIK